MAILNMAVDSPVTRLAGRSPWLVIACLFALFSARPAPAAPASREYQIKAVFLFNFAQFVEWPQHAFPDPQAPFVIGILGPDPFAGALAATVRGERQGGRPFEIRLFPRAEDIDACQVLFINVEDADTLAGILESLKGRPILTVSDAAQFSRRGGMIRLVTENNHVRMRINVEAARAAGLVISSKLLRPAEIVRP